MKGFGAIVLALTSAAAGAAAAVFAMKKREEIKQYDYDFDDDDEVYFDGCDECGCDDCADLGGDMDELNSLDADSSEAAAEASDADQGMDF